MNRHRSRLLLLLQLVDKDFRQISLTHFAVCSFRNTVLSHHSHLVLASDAQHNLVKALLGLGRFVSSDGCVGTQVSIVNDLLHLEGGHWKKHVLDILVKDHFGAILLSDGTLPHLALLLQVPDLLLEPLQVRFRRRSSV